MCSIIWAILLPRHLFPLRIKTNLPAHTLGMKRKILLTDEVKSRDERESCIPAFVPAEGRHGR